MNELERVLRGDAKHGGGSAGGGPRADRAERRLAGAERWAERRARTRLLGVALSESVGAGVDGGVGGDGFGGVLGGAGSAWAGAGRALTAAAGATLASRALPAWLPPAKAQSALWCDRVLYGAAAAIASGEFAPPAALGASAALALQPSGSPLGPPVAVPRGGTLKIIDGTEGGWVEEWERWRVAEV